MLLRSESRWGTSSSKERVSHCFLNVSGNFRVQWSRLTDVLIAKRSNQLLKSVSNSLELWLGDMVVINEISGDWFRGYKVDQPDKLGIFPKCYIHLKPQRNASTSLQEQYRSLAYCVILGFLIETTSQDSEDHRRSSVQRDGVVKIPREDVRV